MEGYAIVGVTRHIVVFMFHMFLSQKFTENYT